MQREFGFWHPPRSGRLYTAYSAVLHLTMSLANLASMSVGLAKQPSIVELLAASAMLAELVSAILKQISLYARRQNVQLVLLDCENFRLEPNEAAYVTARLRFVSVFSISYYASGWTAAFVLFGGAWYQRRLMFAAWYPGMEAHDGDTQFAYLCPYQVCALCVLAWTNMTIELFPCYLMRLMAVRPRTKADEDDDEYRERCRHELIRCVRQHATISAAAYCSDAYDLFRCICFDVCEC